MKRDYSVIGAAGEHLVLSRLLARGILATKAPDGTKAVDLLVHQVGPNGELAGALAIQVKTRTRGANKGWHMSQKHEAQKESWLYFAFVDFEPETPIVYIIPSAKVAKVVEASHLAWLKRPGKRGQAHNDNKLRWIMPDWGFPVPGANAGWLDLYREAWDTLGGAAQIASLATSPKKNGARKHSNAT